MGQFATVFYLSANKWNTESSNVYITYMYNISDMLNILYKINLIYFIMNDALHTVTHIYIERDKNPY